MRTTFDTPAAAIAAPPAPDSLRGTAALTERIASWLRSRLPVRPSLASEWPVGQMNAHMLRDIGLQADQLPWQRPDPALLAMRGGGAFL